MPNQQAMYGEVTTEPFPLKKVPIDQIKPELRRQEVVYATTHTAGTVVVDTPERRLYYVLGDGRAMRYGIGVGRNGYALAGNAYIGRKAEWPTWTPTKEMMERQPETREFAGGMPPGLTNPLGARALYIYQDGRDTLYRLHGTMEVWSIGGAVSSGCVRLLFHDIIDLYSRAPVGTPIIVNQ
jgi:lipoprotein-anchoring transpeptidase ErfK/SrfK